jgi:hypothetical protein
VTRREALPPALLDGLRGPRPLLEPRAVIAQPRAQAQARAVDLVDLGAPPRRSSQSEEEPVRPAVVVGEVGEGDLGCDVRHDGLRPAGTGSAWRPRVMVRLDDGAPTGPSRQASTWIRLPSNRKTVPSAASRSRTAFWMIASKTGCTSVGELGGL